MVFLLQWNKWRSSKIIIYLRLNFNVRQLGGVAPAGGVPTSPGPLDSAMLAKLLFQRCIVQKVELCQITRLSQRMAQKKTACVRYAGGERMHHRAQLAQELPQSRIRSTAPSGREPYRVAGSFAVRTKSLPHRGRWHAVGVTEGVPAGFTFSPAVPALCAAPGCAFSRS